MSDVELLFLVLALIYAWECANWVGRGSAAFVTWFGSRWKQAEPVAVLGNQKGGFVFAAFLPPLGSTLISHSFPVIISPPGILPASSAVSGGAARSLVTFESIGSVEIEGKKINVNGRFFAKAASTTLAARIVVQLRELAKMKKSARESALRKSDAKRFETKSIERLWTAFRGRTSNLQVLTNFLFIYLFVLAPLMIWRSGLAPSWPALLIGLYTLTFSIAFLFRSAHKHFYPAAKDDRFIHFLINLFSPATTIRARDVLSRSLLETFHPLAIAKVFCSEADFKNLSRAVLRDLRYPLKPMPSPAGEASEIDNEFKRRENALLEEFLKKNGMRAEELLRAPKPTDASCLSYCPRCQAQFTFREGKCADCGFGVVAFSSPREKIPAKPA
jgi:hypothetical protein